MKTLVQKLIDHPDQLKDLSLDELHQVCSELRETITRVMSKNPGHFGASMGVVELTVAIHKVFDTPFDQVVWDVGHQTYAHKIMTGRRLDFETIRKKGSLSGFTKMDESEFDSFGCGHSSTSISAALGMAEASRIKGESRRHIAVIGDGALTGGMAFEALNNAAASSANLIVILNDNGMSIDKNVGAIEDQLSKIDPYSNLFTKLGLNYRGPIDGHNLPLLIEELSKKEYSKGIHIIHVKTVKGHGYTPAQEGDATLWHAPGKFDLETGELHGTSELLPPKYQDVFGETLIELAESNDRIVGVTPAMAWGSGMTQFSERYPDRFFDVGIAEQHAVTFSAGLARNGMIPICSIYSTFLQRAIDQVIHDVALQDLHVIFCVDRAGIAGNDGATHHGAFDLSLLNPIPNLKILAPMNELQLRDMMGSAINMKGPVVIRYPRGRGVYLDWKQPIRKIDIGQGRVLCRSGEIAVLSIGHAGNIVREVRVKGHGFSHYDMRSLKPLDHNLLMDAFTNHEKIITIEDGVVNGGLASSILAWMNTNGIDREVHTLGIGNQFVGHGSQEELYAECGYDSVALENLIIALSTPEV